MSKQAVKTYCKILDYVDATDPELADVIRGLCTEMSLTSLKGKPGITFLMPVDKAFRDKLFKLAQSPSIEDANKATDMINAIIIRDIIKTPSDFSTKRDNIPNALYPAQQIEISKVEGNKVVFKSGATAVIDEKFMASNRNERLAVWKLTGELPVTTDKPAKLIPKSATRGKVGAAEGDQNSFVAQAAAIRVQAVEKAEAGYVQFNEAQCLMTRMYMSLVDFILNERSDLHCVKTKLIPVMSFDRSDLYILFEPGKSAGGHLVDDSVIIEWWAQHEARVQRVKPGTIVGQLQAILNDKSSVPSALLYTDRQAVLSATESLRAGLLEPSRSRSIVDNIREIYAALENSNTISGVGPVYPQELLDYYRANPGLKMLHDELRFSVINDLGSKRELSIVDKSSIFNAIRAHTASFGEQRKHHKILPAHFKSLIQPIEHYHVIKLFVNSVMFMYIPLTQADYHVLPTKQSATRPTPGAEILYNPVHIIQEKLLAKTGASEETAKEAILGVNPADLDADAAQMLLALQARLRQ